MWNLKEDRNWIIKGKCEIGINCNKEKRLISINDSSCEIANRLASK